MNAFVAPWQNINPLQYMEAAKAGAALGQQVKSDAQQQAARMAAISASLQNAAMENARANAIAEMNDRREREQAAMALGEATRRSLMENEIENRKLDLGSRNLDLESRKLDIGAAKQNSPFKGVSPTALDAAKILEDSFKRTNALPVDEEGKAQRVFVNPELASTANQELTGLVASGVTPAEATAVIRKKYANLNVSPNVVTNDPGSPAVTRSLFGIDRLWPDKAAVPPTLATNGYVINVSQPQTAASALTQPKGVSANAQTKSGAIAAPQNAKEGDRVQNKKTGQWGTVKNGQIIPDATQ